ncbi:MAG: DNA polymerase III subunit alpha [Rikenellaceae bacterium]|jgi:DNA polymerase-3 subunit alpha|nr:DNA polymerase III subunit alpha [Rikenellaceae bacterium]
MPQFVHLHVHTQYSILDGASDIRKLIRRAKELGMPAVAITDHGNMYGAKEFHDVATAEGVKPILGCEVYVVRDRFEKDKDEKAGDHLILLAKNHKGYQNLCKIVSYSYTEGFYYKPRIDKSLLREYGEGLVCCSACLGGEVPQAIMRGDMAGAEAAIEEFRAIFGDDYYLELQLHRAGDERDRHVYDNQLKVNRVLLDLAAKHGVKYICSNDVHFVMAEDAEAHDHLICLNTGRDLDDPNRMRYTFQEYFKTPDEMAALFADHPEALATTIEIADKIEQYSLKHAPLLPDFPVPEEFEDSAKDTVAKQFDYLRHLAYKGARGRYGEELSAEIVERLEYELKTIEWMGFPGYFLIVWDFIRAAREMGVSVGPGRGSAAGSVVAYALKITNIDPLKYNLLFERFLNPDRVSLPDVDIDFDEDGRGDVLGYVTEKYGKKRVAQIVTFGCMAPKMAIKDVARVEKLSLTESDRLTKLVPDRISPKKGQTAFEHLYEVSPELRAERDSTNPTIRKTLEYAEKLEGSVRQTGVHACGVIIGKDDLELYAPIASVRDKDAKPSKSKPQDKEEPDEQMKNVVQFEGKQVEDVGLIKMDFLGLRTLSIIKDALENIEQIHGQTIDINAVALDDDETYKLFSHGETHGLFQFESAGMRKHLRNLRPTRFEDLIAMNALYRPGPMEYIPSFIKRKNGEEQVSYDLPEMEEYLSDTYGITVYQEQVMLLSRKLAGFTGGEADTLRKAMGKKQKETLAKMKSKFIEGAAAKGHDARVVEKIWGDWESFAEYAFNKSHSTCYAYVAYQTGWLKAHYPAEFMAALLSRNLSDIKNITLYMQECKRMKINVLGPNVNESFHRFSSDVVGNVRFGLAGIKGVGEVAVKSIIAERRESGKFKDVYDFFERINYQTVNKKTLEGLAVAGALDELSGFHRSKFFAITADGGTFLEQMMRYGAKVQGDKGGAQQSLFDMFSADVAIQRPVLPVFPDWSPLETLNKERETIGIYLSSHPLDAYSVVIKQLCNRTLGDLQDVSGQASAEFTVAGMVTGVQNLVSQKGKPYGRLKMEDYDGNTFEFTLFDKDYEKYRIFFYPDYFLFIRGRVQPRSYGTDENEARITSIVQLGDVEQQFLKEICVTVPLEAVNGAFIEALGEAVGSSKGTLALALRVVDRAGGVSVKMHSRRFKVGLAGRLTGFLDDNELKYSIT